MNIWNNGHAPCRSAAPRGRQSSSTKQLSLALVLCLSLTLVLGLAVLSDESSADICDNVTVYVENPDGSYSKAVVGGVSTVKGAVESALNALGMEWEYNSEGKFASVNGRTLDSDHYWRVHQWLPLGTAGWGVMSYDSNSDSYMQTGCSYCLHVSTMGSVDGTTIYSSPDFKPVSTGYVFIRFSNSFDPDNLSVKDTFTSEIRKEGFWLEGTGSSMGEVLKNAVEAQGLDIIMKTGIDGNGNNLQCWITRMFGLGDEYKGDGVWAYWSQWTWVNHEWYYNDWTLGYYDPAVYKYVECIYLLSTPDPYGDGYLIDKGGPEPNPDIDAIVPISLYNTVIFKSGGKKVAQQSVRYGSTVDLSKVPDPEAPEGKVFVGWGDVMAPITARTTFDAKFEDSGSVRQFTVRYYDESKKVLIHTEKVNEGAGATYNGKPAKPDDDEYTYIFKGWSADLTRVTADIDVIPLYEKKSKGGDSPPHTHQWDAGMVVKEPTCTVTGERLYKCTCGETKTESIPVIAHTWSEWIVVEQATETQKGLKERKCSVCGSTEQMEIGNDKIEVVGDLSKTVATLDGGTWVSETKIKTNTVDENGILSTTVDLSAIGQAVQQINELKGTGSDVSAMIVIEVETGGKKETRLELSSEVVAKISEIEGCAVCYSSDRCVIDIGSDIVSAMGGKDVMLSFADDVPSVTDRFASVADGRAIDLSIRSGGVDIHQLNGTMTVKIHYSVPSDRAPEDIRMWYVDGNELREVHSLYDQENGMITFDTTHCSQWIIGFASNEPGSGDDSRFILIIGVLAAIIVASFAVVLYVRR